MAEPTHPIIVGTGLTLFGFATGLHPGLILAGAFGGWLYLIYSDYAMNRLRRTIVVCLAGVMASWFAPAALAVAQAYKMLPGETSGDTFALPLAATFGLLLIPVIIPVAIRFGKKQGEALSND